MWTFTSLRLTIKRKIHPGIGFEILSSHLSALCEIHHVGSSVVCFTVAAAWVYPNFTLQSKTQFSSSAWHHEVGEQHVWAFWKGQGEIHPKKIRSCKCNLQFWAFLKVSRLGCRTCTSWINHNKCVMIKKQDCARIKSQLLLERSTSKLSFDVQHLYIESGLAKILEVLFYQFRLKTATFKHNSTMCCFTSECCIVTCLGFLKRSEFGL